MKFSGFGCFKIQKKFFFEDLTGERKKIISVTIKSSFVYLFLPVIIYLSIFTYFNTNFLVI